MPQHQVVFLDYGNEEDANRAASFVAQLVREGVTFNVEQAGEQLRVTLLGGF